MKQNKWDINKIFLLIILLLPCSIGVGYMLGYNSAIVGAVTQSDDGSEYEHIHDQDEGEIFVNMESYKTDEFDIDISQVPDQEAYNAASYLMNHIDEYENCTIKLTGYYSGNEYEENKKWYDFCNVFNEDQDKHVAIEFITPAPVQTLNGWITISGKIELYEEADAEQGTLMYMHVTDVTLW